MKILIVEDEKHLNDLLHDYVKDAYPDAVIHQVYDGLSALNRVSVEVYDLILLDLVMPGLLGFEVCKALRENPEFSQTPIIVMSAKSYKPDIDKAKALGADAYVVKPVDMEELLRIAKEHLNKRKTAS